MTFSFQKDIKNIKQFESYIEDLMSTYYNGNTELSSNTGIFSTQDITTNVVNLNFTNNLTPEQISYLETLIESYIEPETDENLYRTVPYITNLISSDSTEYQVLYNFLYSGKSYNSELNRIRIRGKITSLTSNSHYYLKVVDITNNIIMGSNNFINPEFEYGVIPLSNIPYDLSTIEIHGKKGLSSEKFEIDGIQLVYNL